MSERTAIENWMLHAYADGELDAHERHEVEARLSSDPAARAEVDAWLDQKAMLKAEFDDVLKDPVPSSVKAALRRGGRPGWFHPSLIAAGLALLIAGGAAGWYAASELGPMQTASFVDRAIVAYEVYSPEVRHPVEVGADQEAHLVTWLSKRLGTQLRAPKLEAVGYTLVGGRLLPGEIGPVAHFMYQCSRGTRVTLYVRSDMASQRSTAFRYTREGPVDVYYWVDSKLGYAVSSGDISKELLLNVANAAYQQLNPP